MMMPVPNLRHEYNGCIQLEIALSSEGDKSYIKKQYYKLPLQVMPPFYQEGEKTIFLYLLNPSGGIMEYDNFLVEISLDRDAQAYITTPSVTKIYRQRTNLTGHQVTVFHMKKGSILEYCPEEVMPFAKSSFCQKTLFYLEEGAQLLAWDILCAGRISRKENFEFQKYKSILGIYIDNRPAILDVTDIQPGRQGVRDFLTMDSYDYVGTLYAYSPGCTQELLEELRRESTDYTDGMVGISLVQKNLLVLKLTGIHAYLVKEKLQFFWNFLRHRLLGKAPVLIRKY